MLREELQASLATISAPESLHQFARNIGTQAVRSDASVNHSVTHRRSRGRGSMLYAGLAAGIAGAVALSLLSAQISPAFASVMNHIPGFTAASEWLSSQRGLDGVDNAQQHGYQPSTPVMEQFGDVKVGIGDVYLTSERLYYKVFISSDELQRHLITYPDGTQGVDSAQVSYHAASLDFPGIGNGVMHVTIEDRREPVMVIASETEVTPAEVGAFLATAPHELRFAFYIQSGPDYSNQAPEKHELSVQFDKSQWQPDRTFTMNESLKLDGVDGVSTLAVDKVTMTPLKTYVDLALNDQERFILDTSHSDPTFHLIDDQGTKYPLDTYFPLYEQEGRDGSGAIRLVFTSSPYFNPKVRELKLQVDEVLISERRGLELSMDQSWPSRVIMNDQELAITGASYADGFLNLDILQQADQLQNVRFSIPSYVAEVLKDEQLYQRLYVEQEGYRRGELRAKEGQEEYEVSLMAPQQPAYQIEMIGERKQIAVGQSMKLRLEKLDMQR